MRPAFATILFLTVGGAMAAPAAAPACLDGGGLDERALAARGYPSRCPSGQTAVSKGVTITTNGCSFVPELDFHACCNAHDRCYATCSRTKRSCDDAFLTCMKNRCNALYDAGVQRTACIAAANTYHAGVAVGADIPFMNASEKYCRCV